MIVKQKEAYRDRISLGGSEMSKKGRLLQNLFIRILLFEMRGNLVTHTNKRRY